MNELAVRVSGVGKKYFIGSEQRKYDRLGEQVVDLIAAPFRRTRSLLRGHATGAAELHETIWALKDVSFEIRPGEVVGIIGRNGAGKSTLLKILARITEPTEGYADIWGRVGSLLEVGTGFHPELTGRENVFLNGAILGMTRAEIESKFDKIVDFAEIETFIDTPVKHYSSGMYVRLAFSVAAHLDPEILLVDEVLAVGDVAFQRKCLGKMGDVASRGRTVLFVSHNMGLMQTLCERGLFLQDGKIYSEGPITEVVNTYLQSLEQAEREDPAIRTDRRGLGNARLTGVRIEDGLHGDVATLKTGESARFVFKVDKLLPGMSCAFSLHDHLGQPVTKFRSSVHGPSDTATSKNGLNFICDIQELLLLPGRYRMDVSIMGDNRLQDALQAAASFDVGEGQVAGRPAKPDKKFRVSMPHQWTAPTRG